ncbi:hypothetical protein HHI36_012919 [Cryptolaemus montrouzieri]|uniref:Zinc finger PHD-type domain-containing protein n=1 Tax=Cryptolaemus montrouzieri TaxID=559131 RepID=A0ABD2NFV6_9CUCU
MDTTCVKCNKDCDLSSPSTSCCDSCSVAFHIKCLPIGGNELRVIEQRKKRSLFFFCDDCKGAIKRLPHILRCYDEIKFGLKTLNVLKKDSLISHDALVAEINDRD